jgi:hypothetical protein
MRCFITACIRVISAGVKPPPVGMNFSISSRQPSIDDAVQMERS